VPFAIELYLDKEADQMVRQSWAALDAHRVRSLGSIPNADYRPHLSLTVFEDGDLTRIGGAVGALLDSAMGMPLTLEPLGFFLTPEIPAFLGVVPTARLLNVHDAVHQAVKPLVRDMWPHYRPDALLPHCTLAMQVQDKATAIEVVSRFSLPIAAHAASAHLVEIPGGITRARLAST
jgi:2'-5' RNA ligase superfamily protein